MKPASNTLLLANRYGQIRSVAYNPLRTGLLLLAAVVQVGLGISTLLLHVPVALAATHQAGAVILLSVILLVNHSLWNARAGE